MRKIAARLGGLAAIALALAGILTAGAAPVAALPAQASPRLAGCSGHLLRPSDYSPACNGRDGTFTKVHWSSWGATASGTALYSSARQCVPMCAYGTFTLYPVDVSAWRIQGGVYTRFEYRFTGKSPMGLARDWVLSYSGGLWHGGPGTTGRIPG
jgi:hypothetical protein